MYDSPIKLIFHCVPQINPLDYVPVQSQHTCSLIFSFLYPPPSLLFLPSSREWCGNNDGDRLRRFLSACETVRGRIAQIFAQSSALIVFESLRVPGSHTVHVDLPFASLYVFMWFLRVNMRLFDWVMHLNSLQNIQRGIGRAPWFQRVTWTMQVGPVS